MGRWTSLLAALPFLTGSCIDGQKELDPVQHDVAGLLLGFCPGSPVALDESAEGEVAVLPGDHPEAIACQTARGEVDVLYQGPSFELDDSTSTVLSAEALETDDPDACPADLTEVGLVLFDRSSRVLTLAPEPPVTRDDGSELRVGVFDMVTVNEGSLTVAYRHRLIEGSVSQKATFEADTGHLSAFPVVTRDGCELRLPGSDGRSFAYRIHAQTDSVE